MTGADETAAASEWGRPTDSDLSGRIDRLEAQLKTNRVFTIGLAATLAILAVAFAAMFNTATSRIHSDWVAQVESTVFDHLQVRQLDVVDGADERKVSLRTSNEGGAIQVFSNRFDGEHVFVGISDNGGGAVRLGYESKPGLVLYADRNSGIVDIYDHIGGYRALTVNTGINGGNPGIWLLSPEETDRAVLSAQTPGLFLHDENGEVTLALRGDDELNAISVKGAEGEDLVRVVRHRQGGHIRTFSSQRPPLRSNQTAFLGTQTQHRFGGLWLHDPEGDIRAVFAAGRNVPGFTLRAAGGETQFHAWQSDQGPTVFQFSDQNGDRFFRSEFSTKGLLKRYYDTASGRRITSDTVQWPRPETD